MSGSNVGREGTPCPARGWPRAPGGASGQLGSWQSHTDEQRAAPAAMKVYLPDPLGWSGLNDTQVRARRTQPVASSLTRGVLTILFSHSAVAGARVYGCFPCNHDGD